MASCVASTIALVQPDTINLNLYERVWRLCGNQTYNNLFFADFEIRRDKFVHQKLDERVNLWMVVCITISGVLLAGIQLFMAYRLANAGRAEFAKDTSLLAEQGKISLQSSITGVIVLVISLAFFVVYVKWIYSMTDVEIHIERPTNLTAPEPRVLSRGGGLIPLSGSARSISTTPTAGVATPSR
jgi:hypothetical protein